MSPAETLSPPIRSLEPVEHGIYAVIGPDRASIVWWQICIRAVIIFFYGAAVIRIAGKRAFGRQSSLDIILSVLIGSALARAMTGNAPFFGTIAGTSALIGLYQAMIHLTERSDAAGFVLKGRPLPLIRDGVVDTRAMREAGVSRLDLEEAIRIAGVHDLTKVEQATLERNGHISVEPKKAKGEE